MTTCAQAAQKALTEMDCVPEPTPQGRQQAQAALTAAPASPPPSPPPQQRQQPPRRQSEPGCRAGQPPGSCEREPRLSAATARRVARRGGENDAFGACAPGQARGGEGRRWTPLQTVDGNRRAGQAADAQGDQGGSYQDRDAAQPDAGARAPSMQLQRRPRVRPGSTGFIDFGVQIYAPEQPPAPPAPQPSSDYHEVPPRLWSASMHAGLEDLVCRPCMHNCAHRVVRLDTLRWALSLLNNRWTQYCSRIHQQGWRSRRPPPQALAASLATAQPPCYLQHQTLRLRVWARPPWIWPCCYSSCAPSNSWPLRCGTCNLAVNFALQIALRATEKPC